MAQRRVQCGKRTVTNKLVQHRLSLYLLMESSGWGFRKHGQWLITNVCTTILCTVPRLRHGNAASGSAPPTAMVFFCFFFQSGSSPLLTNLVWNTFTVPSVIQPCTEASDYRFRLLLKYDHHQVLSLYSHHCVFCQHTAIIWYSANIQPSLRILLIYSHHWIFVNIQSSSRILPIYSHHRVFCRYTAIIMYSVDIQPSSCILSIYSHHRVFCQYTAIIRYFVNIKQSSGTGKSRNR